MTKDALPHSASTFSQPDKSNEDSQNSPGEGSAIPSVNSLRGRTLYEENIPLRDYLAQRDALLKEDEDHKREQLIRANESIIKTRKELYYGRGNVIPDLEKSNFSTAARAEFSRDLYDILYSEDIYEKYEDLGVCLPSDEVTDQVRENAEDDDDFSKKMNLIYSTAIAMLIKSGNCNEYAAVSMLDIAIRLGEGKITSSVIGLGEFDHVWVESGDIVVDAWAEGSTIFKEDINPLYEDHEKDFSLNNSSAQLYFDIAQKMANNLQNNQDLMIAFANIIKKKEAEFNNAIKNGTWDYRNDPLCYNPVSILSSEFIKKSESEPKSRREKILSDKTEELLNNLAKEGKSKAEAEKILSKERDAAAAVLQDIRKIGVNQRHFGLTGLESIAHINSPSSKKIIKR